MHCVSEMFSLSGNELNMSFVNNVLSVVKHKDNGIPWESDYIHLDDKDNTFCTNNVTGPDRGHS